MTALDWIAILGAGLLYALPLAMATYYWIACVRAVIMYLDCPS